MKCNEVRILLDAIADQELPENEIEAVMAHVDDCSRCGSELAELRKLRKCLSSLPHSPASVELRGVIVDAIGEEARTRASPANWQWARPVMTHAAAALAGALILYGVIYLPQHAPQLQGEILTAHVRSLGNDGLVQVAAGDPHKIKPWFAGKLNYSPIVVDLAATGFPLEGARVDNFGANKVAALVYARRNHKINLFILPESQTGADQPAAFMRNGFNIVHWRARGFQFWAISDLSEGELMEFSNTVISEIR